MSFPNLIKTTVIENRHKEIYKAIREIASAHNRPFINAAKNLRHAASMELIHGPVDWNHFNKGAIRYYQRTWHGYFFSQREGGRLDDCVY